MPAYVPARIMRDSIALGLAASMGVLYRNGRYLKRYEREVLLAE